MGFVEGSEGLEGFEGFEGFEGRTPPAVMGWLCATYSDLSVETKLMISIMEQTRVDR